MIRKQREEDRILQKAESFLGVTELPAGSNKVLFNTDYYGAEVSGPYYLWCVVFLWDIFRMCGLSALFYNGEKTNECIKVHQWGEANNLLIPKEDGRYGDIAIYSWKGDTLDHIGLITGRNADGSYTTIGYIPALLNDERVEIGVVFDSESPYGRITGAKPVYGNETDTEAKGEITIEKGDSIQPICDIYGADGSYSSSNKLGKAFKADELYLANMRLTNDSVSVTYRIKDIYGNIFFTPALNVSAE